MKESLDAWLFIDQDGRMTTNKENAAQSHKSIAENDGKHAWSIALDSYRERRAVRASLKSTERELSTYTTPAELEDLDSMLERCADDNDSVYGPMIERIRLRAA